MDNSLEKELNTEDHLSFEPKNSADAALANISNQLTFEHTKPPLIKASANEIHDYSELRAKFARELDQKQRN